MWMIINLGHNSKFCIFSAYGPPEESSNNENNKRMSNLFWDELQKQLKIVRQLYPEIIIIIIAGDFNARVGKGSNEVDTSIPPLIGSKLMERSVFNRNGNELLAFCQHNKCAIANTYFAYDMTGTGTWRNPSEKYENQYALDHILIQQNYLFGMVAEGGVVEDVGLPTDHRATKILLRTKEVILKFNIDTKKKRKRLLSGKLDFSKLNEDSKIMKNFRNQLNGALNYKSLNERLENNIMSMNEVVDVITKNTKSISSSILPKKKDKIDPEWYTLNKQRIDTWIRRKNELWDKFKVDKLNDYLHEQYTSYRSYFRAMLREIQEKYWNNYFISLRAAHDAGRSNQFYKLMNQCMGIKVKNHKGGISEE